MNIWALGIWALMSEKKISDSLKKTINEFDTNYLVYYSYLEISLMRRIFQGLRLKTVVLNKIQYRFSKEYVASVDQSTTSTKFSVFTTSGKLIEQEII